MREYGLSCHVHKKIINLCKKKLTLDGATKY